MGWKFLNYGCCRYYLSISIERLDRPLVTMLLALRRTRTFVREGSSRNLALVSVGYDSTTVRVAWYIFIYHFECESDSISWHFRNCLLYTSDAADDLTRVDLGGRRI